MGASGEEPIGGSTLASQPVGNDYAEGGAAESTPADDLAAVLTEQACIIEQLTAENRELTLANLRGQPIAEGKGWGEVGLWRDVTELRRTQERLIETNASLAVVATRLESLVESLPDGVLVLDGQGMVTLVNEVMRGLVPEVTVGTSLADLLASSLRHSNGDPLLEESFPLAKALGGEKVDGEEMAVFGPEGRRLDLLVRAIPIVDDHGAVSEVVAVFADVSAIKDLNRHKDRFISVASHELKTPLTSIKGYSQLLLRQARFNPEQPVQVTSLEAIVSSVNRMQRIIEELLDVSRIQLNVIKLAPSWVDLLPIVRRAVEQWQVTTSKHRLRLLCDLSSIVGRWDEDRLDQVLGNLIGNAIKYSPGGGLVEVTVTVLEGSAVVSVRDQGLGILEGEQSTIFEPFVRASAADKLAAQGLGLGLYICQQIIALHGGSLSVASQPHAGSVFTFSLPISGPVG